MSWTPDLLGDAFEQRTLSLPPDAEGPVVATLVRKRTTSPAPKAVLYIHGYVDYFFQTEMANEYVARGYDFYAIDLRKYGRSLRPHQTPVYITDLYTYFEDLDAALQVIRTEDGHDTVLINAHSTGGLIASLYAHHRRDRRWIQAMMLNSPFLEFNFSWPIRTIGGALLSALGAVAPRIRVRKPFTPFYAHSLLKQYKGEWDYNLEWKPIEGFPVYMAWVRAIRRGHQEVHRGLGIPCPIQVMSSDRSSYPTRWNDDILRTDIVLSVDQMSQYCPRLGVNVTRILIPNAIHDIMLSARSVRETVYREHFQWLERNMHS